MNDSAPALDDLSKVTATVDFAYDEIDRRVFGVETSAEEAIEESLECQRRIWQWVYQPPNKDMDGFVCRSIVACWVFVPPLRAYSMTDIAGRFGKKKQSIGRWVADFKKEFPAVAAHLQHIKNTK